MGCGESVRGVHLKVRIVVAIAVFGYSVCKFGGNLSLVAVFVWELHARRKEGTLCIFIFFMWFWVLLSTCGDDDDDDVGGMVCIEATLDVYVVFIEVM